MFGADLPPPAGRLLTDGESLAIGDLSLKVIHSPGHTPGSILALLAKDCFLAAIRFSKRMSGRTDLPGGSEKQLRCSLEKIKSLPPRTVILPGHGVKSSVLEIELRNNPYL